MKSSFLLPSLEGPTVPMYAGPQSHYTSGPPVSHVSTHSYVEETSSSSYYRQPSSGGSNESSRYNDPSRYRQQTSRTKLREWSTSPEQQSDRGYDNRTTAAYGGASDYASDNATSPAYGSSNSTAGGNPISSSYGGVSEALYQSSSVYSDGVVARSALGGVIGTGSGGGISATYEGSRDFSYGGARDTNSTQSSYRPGRSSDSSWRSGGNSPQRTLGTPSWVLTVLSEAGDAGLLGRASPRDAILAALDRIRAGDVAPETLLDDIPSIIKLLSDEPSFSDPSETFAVIAALHVCASDSLCRDAIIESDGVRKITTLVDNASSPATPRILVSGDRSSIPSPAPLRTSLSSPVWDGAVRLMSKLVVLSPSACSDSIQSPLLSIIAAAALPTESFDTRIRAAAGIASITAWSGPRFAVEILETKNVIASMAAILTDRDERIPSHLRRATLDGLTVMAHRRRARLILTQNGCGEFISIAARLASMSGDYDIAARSTVVAGHLCGHSVDEFGFLVEKEGEDAGVDSVGDFGGLSPGVSQPSLMRGETALGALQKELMEEEGLVKGTDAKGLERVIDRRSGPNASAASSVDISGSGDPYGTTSFDAQKRTSFYPESSGEGVTPGGLAQDPDHDRSAEISPLVGFTSATERAAARNSSNATEDKTPRQKQAEEKNEQIWENVLKNRPDDLQREKGINGRILAYRELAVVPIPTKLRSSIWPKLLNIEDLRARKPGLYDALCNHGKENELPEDIEHTIEADLTRTMPFHCLFWQSGAAPGIDALRRVLRAYAFHVPSVGYCQGMSSIAALILLNSQSEEDAFLMIVRFLSWYGYKNVFKPGFPQFKEWVEEFRSVLEARHPHLYQKLESEGVMPELYLDKGIITCLTHNYPHRVLVRVWDLMLLGGSPKIILKVCLSVLVMSEKKLMSMQFEAIVGYLQRGFADPISGVVKDENVEEFLDVARSLKLTTEPVAPTARTPGHAQVSSTQTVPVERETKSRSGLSACFPCFSREKQD